LSPGGPVRDMATSGLNFDYLVTIIMENHNLCEIYTHCGGTGVYMTALADAYSISLQDSYCNVNPSLPNYLCLSGGTDFGCAGYDGDPNSNSCTNSAWNSENIIDRIVGGGYGETIYTVWAGPVVKTAYTSQTAYDHFSVLSTIESNWNLPPLTSNDQNAPKMNEFFTTPQGPDFSLSANPSTVSFVAGDS